MTLFRKSGSAKWYVKIMVRGELYRWSSGTADKKRAREFEQQRKTEIYDQEKLGKIAPMTLGEACKRYGDLTIEARAETNLDSTLAASRSRLLKIINDLGSDTKVHMLTTARIEMWKADMLADAYKPASVDRALQVLRAVLNRAKKLNAVREVPEFDLLNVDNSRLRYLGQHGADEEQRLTDSCARDQDLWDTVVFLLDTGGRRGDALQLEWHDVLFDQDAVYFHHTKTDLNRHVPMTDRVRAMLKRRQAVKKTSKVFPYHPTTLVKQGLPEDALRLRPTGPGKLAGVRAGPKGSWYADIKVAGKKEHLGSFRSEDEALAARQAAEVRHGAVVGTGFRAAWTAAITAAKLEHLTVHDLRHSYASKLVQAGVDLYTVGQLLGHKDPKMTQRYAHLSKGDLHDAVKVLNPSAASSRVRRSGKPSRD